MTMKSTLLALTVPLLLWADGSLADKVPASLRKLSVDGTNQQVSVIAFLADRFDANQVAHIADKNEKAAEVLSGLQKTAERSQQALIRSLNANPRVTRVHSYYVTNAVVVEGDVTIVETLERRPDVKSIMNNVATKQLNLPTADEHGPFPFKGRNRKLLRKQDGRNLQTTYEWNIKMIGADRVHTEFGTGTGAVVANQDTGIRYTHEILRDNYRGGTGGSIDHNFNWFDGIKSNVQGGDSNVCGFNSPVPCDDNGHGTHCIGTSVGGLGYGVAPGSKWIGCRNMDNGYGSPETYLACFQFFLAPTDLSGNNPDHTLRPHVIGNSWTCPSVEGCSGGEFAEVIANLKQAGVASILSASNDGPSCGSMGNPATDINVTSVASVQSDGTISSFSSRGPTTDGRVGPTISAPGANVRSSTHGSDTSYSTKSGTSMASPHVTGAWALVASLCPAYAYDVDATEALLLRHTVQDQVQVDDCGSDSDSSYPNNVYGAGLLDIYAAVSECAVAFECSVDADCADGSFCNGLETCNAGTCVPGTPCQNGCDEDNDTCFCIVDADCDDGSFCNGVETCDIQTGICQVGTPVSCPSPTATNGCATGTSECDEITDACSAIIWTPDDTLCVNSETCETPTCSDCLSCNNDQSNCEASGCTFSSTGGTSSCGGSTCDTCTQQGDCESLSGCDWHRKHGCRGTAVVVGGTCSGNVSYQCVIGSTGGQCNVGASCSNSNPCDPSCSGCKGGGPGGPKCKA